MEKKQIRLIAFDMDGTVLYDRKEISPRLQAILKKALAQGIYVVPCTGRGRCEVPATVAALPMTHSITSNGALCVDEGADQVLHENLIPWEKAVKIFRELKEMNTFVTVHMDGIVYFEHDDEEYIRDYYDAADYMKIHLTHSAADLVAERKRDPEKVYARAENEEHHIRVKQAVSEIYPLFYSSSATENMEFSMPGCSKGSTLKWLCEYLKVEPDQVVAFGDGENDKEMLTFAGIGVAVGNANPICKAAADVVIGTYAEDAVASYLEELLGC